MIRVRAQIATPGHSLKPRWISVDPTQVTTMEQFLQRCAQTFSIRAADISHVELSEADVASVDILQNNDAIEIFLHAPKEAAPSLKRLKTDSEFPERVHHQHKRVSSIIDILGDDILLHVALQLREASDIVSWIQTCKIFHQWSDVLPSLWRHWCTQRGWRPKRDFRSPETLVRTGITPSEPDWRKEFISNHRMSVKLRQDFGKVMEWMQHHHPDVHKCIQSNLKPAANEEIEAAETRMRHPLANDLKEFVKITNGFPPEITALLHTARDPLEQDASMSEADHCCWNLLRLQPTFFWPLLPLQDRAYLQADVCSNYSIFSSESEDQNNDIDNDSFENEGWHDSSDSVASPETYYDLRFLLNMSQMRPKAKPLPGPRTPMVDDSADADSEDGSEIDPDDIDDGNYSTELIHERWFYLNEAENDDDKDRLLIYDCWTGIITVGVEWMDQRMNAAQILDFLVERLDPTSTVAIMTYARPKQTWKIDLDDMLAMESISNSPNDSEDEDFDPKRNLAAASARTTSDVSRRLFDTALDIEPLLGDYKTDVEITGKALKLLNEAAELFLREVFELGLEKEREISPDSANGDISLRTFQMAAMKVLGKRRLSDAMGAYATYLIYFLQTTAEDSSEVNSLFLDKITEGLWDDL